MEITIIPKTPKTDMGEPKEDYYKLSLKETASLPSGRKPTFLLHVCCGPCASFPLLFLCPHFDLTLYYDNSNIYPEEEFYRRRGELEKLLGYYKRDYGFDIRLIKPNYDHEGFMKDLRVYACAKEGGERCLLCYKKRMSEAYDYAESHGFDYFATVMSISRQKNSAVLNEIGKDLEQYHPTTKYFYNDFKKANGQLYSQSLRKHYALYNQLYCGCEYSFVEGKQRLVDKGMDPSLILPKD